MRFSKIIRYLPRLVAAALMLQTLWFKFGLGGAAALEVSVALFTHLSEALFGHGDHEAVLRVTTGILELIASILLLLPGRMGGIGALLGAGLMGGALLSHLLFIGIAVDMDGGQLMIMALVVLLCCIKVAYDERRPLFRCLKK